ncbi:MAG: hypothetical protein GY757_55575 [bacterium]|nr:hypothetical protein [bacterium]
MAEIKNPSKEIDLDEFMTLFHVPEVKEILFYELEKLREGYVKKRIDAYYKKKDDHFKEMMGEPMSYAVAGVARMFNPTPFWFEISRSSENRWTIISMTPTPPDVKTVCEILPRDIIDEIVVESPVDVDKVEEITGMFSPTLYKHYDIKFVKASSNHIYGTVTENNKIKKKIKDVMVDEAQLESKRTEKTFFRYLNKIYKRSIFKHLFIDAFCKHVYPIIQYYDLGDISLSDLNTMRVEGTEDEKKRVEMTMALREEREAAKNNEESPEIYPESAMM